MAFVFFGGLGVGWWCRWDQFSSAVQEKTKAVVVDSLLYLASVVYKQRRNCVAAFNGV